MPAEMVEEVGMSVRGDCLGEGACFHHCHPSPLLVWPVVLHHTPHTLYPTPYNTLHPTPYTLHPTPYTLHPISMPETLYPRV
jgi:hypothetical protein